MGCFDGLQSLARCHWIWDEKDFVPFHVDHCAVGHIRAERVDTLLSFADVFRHEHGSIVMNRKITAVADRSAVLAEVCTQLADDGLIPPLRGEPYAIVTPAGPPCATLDRSASLYFGIYTSGVHLNGLRRSESSNEMWLARRAMHKRDFPGLLDNLVGGAQPFGLSLEENLHKEAMEEALIGRELLRSAVPRGSLRYHFANRAGLVNSECFIYDVTLPWDFKPVNTDGEVEEFIAVSYEEALNLIQVEGNFKFNSGLVVMEFLLRAGLLSDTEPDFYNLVSSVYRRH